MGKRRMLFRGSIKTLDNVSTNLRISFDHGAQVILDEKNRNKLRFARKYTDTAIRILREIE